MGELKELHTWHVDTPYLFNHPYRWVKALLAQYLQKGDLNESRT